MSSAKRQRAEIKQRSLPPTDVLWHVLSFFSLWDTHRRIPRVCTAFRDAVRVADQRRTLLHFDMMMSFRWMVFRKDLSICASGIAHSLRESRPRTLTIASQCYEMIQGSALRPLMPVLQTVESVKVDIWARPFDDEGLYMLCALPKLRTFVWDVQPGTIFGPQPWHLLTLPTSPDLVHISARIKAIDWLSLWSDDQLAKLTTLEQLDYTNGDVNGQTLEQLLRKLPRLRRLGLSMRTSEQSWRTAEISWSFLRVIGQHAPKLRELVTLPEYATGSQLEDIAALFPLAELECTLAETGHQLEDGTGEEWLKQAVRSWPRMKRFRLSCFDSATFFTLTMNEWPLLEGKVHVSDSHSTMSIELACRWLVRHPRAQVWSNKGNKVPEGITVDAEALSRIYVVKLGANSP